MKRPRTTSLPPVSPYRNNGNHNGNGNFTKHVTNVLNNNPLTIQQQLFVKEYLKDLNATQAAIRAGYSINNAGPIGCMILKNVNVRSAIVEEMSKRAAKIDVDAEWVLLRIKLLVERCLQMEPVLLPDGKIVEFKFDSAGATRALELLGRHLKLFPTHVKLDGRIQTEEVGPAAQAFNKFVSSLSDDKLFELRSSIKRIAEGTNGECHC